MDDFEVIYKKYAGIVKKYLMSLGADNHLSDDMTADTFLKALKNIHRFDECYSVPTWLCTIAKRTYFDYLKKKENLSLPITDEIVADDYRMEAAVENDELRVKIHKAIVRLENPYKDVIYLRLFAGLSFLEIGIVMSKSENWARVTFYRGKLKLREALKNEV